MPVGSVLLVLLAAVTHATWNLLAKRAAHAGAAFLFWSGLFACLFYAPWAGWLIAVGGIDWQWPMVACIAVSALIHLLYSFALQKGYRVADLSVVYPIARGSGPLLSSLAAFTLFAESPGALRLAGLVAVVGGILLIATDGHVARLARSDARAGVVWGGATGSLIASYTLVDGYGVKRLGIDAVLLDWFANLLRLLILAVAIAPQWRASLGKMSGHWCGAIGVGFLSPLGYILVLKAMAAGAPVSIVAPMRELSMMLVAVLGMLLLGEKVSAARLAGCATMVGGVVLLGLS
ncbi:DMT family transporter [Tsuneonella rigui]|uniref:DMT family transporter n=1 Tax=Tsuneonella rigui TaxID=1708790 RepID=UPI000F7DE8AA|nr:DMT family transporter [Tsuneonella rigui]